MTQHRRSDWTKDRERASRRRKQDASDELKRALEALPRVTLEQYLAHLDPNLNNERRGFSQAQIYLIAAIIVRYATCYYSFIPYSDNLPKAIWILGHLTIVKRESVRKPSRLLKSDEVAL